MRRRLGRLFSRYRRVCFACGRTSEFPCRGHEYGGTIMQPRPTWIGRRVPLSLYGWAIRDEW